MAATGWKNCTVGENATLCLFALSLADHVEQVCNVFKFVLSTYWTWTHLLVATGSQADAFFNVVPRSHELSDACSKCWAIISVCRAVRFGSLESPFSKCKTTPGLLPLNTDLVWVFAWAIHLSEADLFLFWKALPGWIFPTLPGAFKDTLAFTRGRVHGIHVNLRPSLPLCEFFNFVLPVVPDVWFEFVVQKSSQFNKEDLMCKRIWSSDREWPALSSCFAASAEMSKVMI